MAQEIGSGHMMPHGDLTRSSAGYKALQRITVSVRSQIDLRRVLELLAADAGRFLDLSLCSLARWDELGGFLVFRHEYLRGSGGSAPSLQGRRFAPGAEPEAEAFEALVFKEQRSLISRSCADAMPGGAAFLSPLAGSAWVVTPLVADLRVAGLMVAARPRDLPEWADHEIQFLRAAADLAAVAIQHAALRSHLRVLSAAAAELNSRLDRQGLLRRLTEAAMSVTGSTMGVAGIREGDEMVCRELCRSGAWQSIDLRFKSDRGLPGWSWTNRVPCIANDARTDPRADSDLISAAGIISSLTVPVVDRDGEVLGFFELHNKTTGAPYGEEDVHLASALAHQAAMALAAKER